MNDSERVARAYSIVETPSHKELVIKGAKLGGQHSKAFQLDRVFGPQSQQLQVYKAVVEPLVDQVCPGVAVLLSPLARS